MRYTAQIKINDQNKIKKRRSLAFEVTVIAGQGADAVTNEIVMAQSRRQLKAKGPNGYFLPLI